MSFAALVELEL